MEHLVQAADRTAGGRKWVMLLLLTLLYTCSFVDRQVIVFMVDPIRADLGISDTEVGLLLGPAFAILFSIATIPFGLMVDRVNRARLVGVGVSLWSLMTAGSGIVTSFLGLFVCRMGVGLGEAALTPAAHSLVSDLFPPRSRGLALSIYSAGVSLGAGLAAMIGGYVIKAALGIGHVTLPLIGAVAPWQLVFLVIGLPGLLLAALMVWMGDPRHGLAQPTISVRPGAKVAGTADAAAAYATLILGVSLLALFGYGVGAWLPTYFIRVHHVPVQTIGMAYGAGVILCGLPGNLLCGYASMLLIRRGRADAAHLLAVATGLLAFLFAGASVLAPTPALGMAAMFGFLAFGAVWNGAAAAALQALAPPGARGRVAALYLLGLNVIGQGVGPFAVAFATDHVFARDGAIGSSLLLVGALSTAGAIALLLGGRRVYLRALAQREALSPAG